MKRFKYQSIVFCLRYLAVLQFLLFLFLFYLHVHAYACLVLHLGEDYFPAHFLHRIPVSTRG